MLRSHKRAASVTAAMDGQSATAGGGGAQAGRSPPPVGPAAIGRGRGASAHPGLLDRLQATGGLVLIPCRAEPPLTRSASTMPGRAPHPAQHVRSPVCLAPRPSSGSCTPCLARFSSGPPWWRCFGLRGRARVRSCPRGPRGARSAAANCPWTLDALKARDALACSVLRARRRPGSRRTPFGCVVNNSLDTREGVSVPRARARPGPEGG